MKAFFSFRSIVLTVVAVLLVAYSAAPAAAQTYSFRTREASMVRTAQQIKSHNGFSDTIVVRQDKWDEMVASGAGWGSNLKFKSVHAFVKFYVNHAYPRKIPEPYTFRLTYRVLGYGNMSDTSAVTYSGFDTLTISYKPDSLAAFQDIQYKKYSNLHKIMIVTTGLYRITGANTAPVAMDLSTNSPFYLLNFNVEGSIVVQPFHKKVWSNGGYKDVYGPDFPKLDIASEAPADDYLPVAWNLEGTTPLNSALSLTPVNYELEWTYVDNYKVDPAASVNGVSTIAPGNLSYNFRDNSTRIWLDTNYYRIPLIYQKGYLVYRVRAVRPDSTLYQYPVYGPWTLGEQGTVGNVAASDRFEITQAHLNDSLNWQYTVSFAEEGKYKHVMSYYDGMLKNRQSITRFNSVPGKLIATEQIYDYEGRPSISLLPTPVNSGSFRYQPRLTLNAASGLPYRASDFDRIPAGVCSQDMLIAALSPVSPAYQYYSPANPDQAGFQKFVPDAGGYPFVQTVYSPGFDERVEKQGGAGDSLQIGLGHHVKNDYVSSDQTDLNRLFGSDIGWSGYYRKTVSRDPNGQLSLNVTDYKGRTVTSSMVGIPDTLSMAIEPNKNVPDTSFFYEDHIAGTSQQVMGNKKILDKNFFNDNAGNNQSQYFYSFTPFPTFCNGLYLSVKARYDYSIFDECGQLRVDTGGTLGRTGVVRSGATLTDSSKIVPFFMEKGRHSLHKELTINMDDVKGAVEDFIQQKPDVSCLKDEPWFIKEAVLSKQFPCPEAPDLNCGTCDGKKFQMIKELWPNKDSVYVERKYGVYDKDFGTVIGTSNSIFTLLCGNDPDPRKWKLQIGGEQLTLSADGPGGSGLYVVRPGSFGPAVVAGSGFVLSGSDTLHCRYRYQDECLVQLPASVTRFGHTYTQLRTLPVDTFIAIFSDSIAEALLPLHPEYCQLLACVKDNYQRKLSAIPNAEVADQLHLFRLRDMILADPIYAKMLLQPARYPSPYDTLAFSSQGRISLDTLALLRAYCQCQDSFMMVDCYNNLFGQQIQNGILNDPYAREQYYKLVRSLYLTNRERYKPLLSGTGDCSTCQPIRMRLSPPPVFPESVAAGGQPAFGSGIMMGMGGTGSLAAGAAYGFQSQVSEYYQLLQIADPDSMASFVDSTHTYTFNQLRDSAFTVYNNYNNSLCSGAVDQIIAQLVNCVLPPANLNNVRTSLMQLCSSGQVQQGFYTPAQIRWALTSNGIALGDLCNPYLVNYDNNMNFNQQGPGNFRCSNEGFYADISATLNQAAVLNALAQPGTSSTVTLSNLNGFQQGIIQSLGASSCTVTAAYSSSAHLYTLRFISGANEVKVYFRTAESGACSAAFAPNPGETLSISVSCINNSPFSQFASGLVGKYTFATTVTHTAGSVVSQCLLPSWNNRIAINSTGENPLAGSVPCTQLRELYRTFSDTLKAYQIKGTDHPYYGTVLRNYMNYKLKKAYSLDQYLDVITGCSLADSIRMDRYQAYAQLQFSNDAAAVVFLNSINALDPAVVITPFRRWQGASGWVAIQFDFRQIPVSKLAIYRKFIDSYNAPGTDSKYVNETNSQHLIDHGYPNNIGLLFQRGTSQTFGPLFRNFSINLLGVYNIWNGSAYEQGKLYSIATGSLDDYAANNLTAYLLQRYFPDNSFPATYYPAIQSTVNGEYLLPEKQAFLNYTYNKQGQPATAVLDTILPQPLGAGVGLFSNKMLRYGYPAEPGRIEHLYVADPATATSDTRYPMLEYILNRVKSQLSGRILFSGAPVRNISVPAGEQLTAYRCRDTAFWYRYFGQGDTLFNVFVGVPDYIDTSYFNQYVVTGLTFNPGEGDSRSFKVTLESNINPPLPKLELNGYTDFVVARNKVLHNVLLAHAVNESIPLGDTINNCERLRLKAAIYEGKVRYRQYIDSIRTKLTGDFYAYIMGGGIQEKLKVGYRNQRFNYTLYYYDRAGNLMRTVPPAGVTMLGGTNLNGVDGARAGFNTSSQYLPAHLKPSDYKYNSLNQVVQQNTPDGGSTNYFYDAAGRAIFSQNAKQRETGRMTYTLYDKQGRIMETGQAIIACVPYFEPYPSPTGLNSNPCSHYIAGTITPFPDVVQELQQKSHDEVVAYVRSLSREEVVLTHYDFAALHLQGAAAGLSPQENLRKRVSCIKYFDNLEPSDGIFEKYRYALHFSYDIAGNVKTLTRDYPFWKTEKQQFKRIDYDYDVISGKVNMLSYNRGFADQYYQRYRYDGDNRIIKVETSADGYVWKRDAEYQYYQHGPLARTSLGDLRVQGVDYAYTIQGWLKAVNGDMLSPDSDMGKDAAANNIHAADVMALSLDYFKGDYRPIGTTPVVQLAQPERSLYNGNIPRATTNLRPFPALNTEYRYDQLNRITKAGYAYINPYNGQLSRTSDYYSSYAYDPDGNLQQLVRNGNAVGGQSQLMDSLSYHYQPGGSNNRLQNITDVISNNSFHNDIKHYTNSGASRYLYDATGNTIKDQVSGQDSILWSHYNKVSSTRRDSLGNNLDFAYDGAGNRYLKTIVRSSGDTTLERSDYYVRDAQGNILAVYDAESSYTMSTRQWVEYITTRLMGTVTLEQYTSFVLTPHYALEGHFRDFVLKRVQENSGYMQLLADAWPVSFYVTHNKAIKSNILNFAGNYPDFYQQLSLFAKSTGQPLLAAALYNDLYRNDELNTAFLQQLLSQAGEGTIRSYTLELLCRTADTMMQAQFKEMDLAYTTNPGANAKLLDDNLRDRPELIRVVSEGLNKKIVDYGFGDQYWSFLQSFSTDATVLSSPVYFDTKNKALLVEFCQRAMQRHASDSVLGAYFDTWKPAKGVLQETSNPQTLLQVVYNAAPAGFLQHYIVNGAGGDLSITYDALSRVPWIRPWDYAELWRPLVRTDSIIHTVYEEVVRSRRISLAEHHLYGSSRLGMKKYLPGQYYLNWDNSGPQPVVDTITLNARSPWYSLEYNDDISALVQQPWNQTETAPFLAGHSVGQKQYELSNHLGNVQATVSDYPYMHPIGEGDSIRMRSAAIVSAYDYYPFGMLMPGRGTDSINTVSNVMGNTLLVYNDFSDGTTQGWQNYGGGVVSNENQQLRVNINGEWNGAMKVLSVVPGRQYRLRCRINRSGSYNMYSNIFASSTWSSLYTQWITPGVTQYDYSFTPGANQYAFVVESYGGTPSGTGERIYIDNFIFEEIKPQPQVSPVVSNGCMTMTQSKWVTTWVDSCYYVYTWQWPNYSTEVIIGDAVATTTIRKTPTAVEFNIPNNEAAVFSLSAVPGMAHTLDMDFENIQGNALLAVQEVQNGAWTTIASTVAGIKGNYILNFTPKEAQVKLKIIGPCFVGFRKLCVKRPVMKQENVLVDVCPADKDKYRFGYNGQEKVNEWAGIGNFLEFSERGQDTRTGRFLRVDPIATKYPWNSTYAFAENDVIRAIDLEGLERVTVTGNAIKIEGVKVVFTERPSATIDGRVYSGGNVTSTGVDLINKSYTELNKATESQVYKLSFRRNPVSGQILNAYSDPATDKEYKLQYDIKVMQFKNEDEMRSSPEYSQALKSKTLMGMGLYGKDSYFESEAGGNKGVVLPPGVGGKAVGDKLGTGYKATLIGPTDYNSGTTVTHEDGHNMGLSHVNQGDEIGEMKGEYNSIGLMKGTHGPEPTKQEAPSNGMLIKIVNTLPVTETKP